MDKDMENETAVVLQKTYKSYQVISVAGTLVYQNMQRVKEKINEIFTESEGYILDFTELIQIDSTGFGLIFNIIKRMPANASMVAAVSDPFIKELFNITKIDQLISIVTSIAEAQIKIEEISKSAKGF